MQALPLWGLAASSSALLTGVCLLISGIANGVRAPPIAGLTAVRVPPQLRGEVMTATGSLILGSGFLALLLAGPALGALPRPAIWIGIASAQTLAALLIWRACTLAGQPHRAVPRGY